MDNIFLNISYKDIMLINNILVYQGAEYGLQYDFGRECQLRYSQDLENFA
jgi:hypothetical protein